MKKTRLEIGPEENPACGHTDRREEMLADTLDRLAALR